MKYIDIHCHILPRVDDGSQDMETTLEMLRIAEGEGITDIIVTPHYRSGRFRGERSMTDKRLTEVRAAMAEAGIRINLYPSCEIYYRSELEEKLESGTLSTMNDTEYVLVEFSPMEDYMYIRSAMEELFSIGYTPILAHAERVQCMMKKPERVRELKNMGCDIQVNAASAVGETGFLCKRFVHKILKEGLVDYIGTDAHNTDKRKPAIKKCAELLYRKYDQEYADAILYKNAAERLLHQSR